VDPRALVVHLESPYSEHSPALPAPREIVLAGLRWSGEHWSGLAVSWLEQGVPIGPEIAAELSLVSANHNLSQQLRHRAFALARSYLSGLPLEELDVVRVVRLLEPNRQFTGTEGVKRRPRAGDKGTVVQVHSPVQGEAAFIVEAIDSEGYTLWLADFVASELQLEWKYHAGT